MAATVGILNGTDVLVYIGANPLMHATDCSFQLSHGLRDASTKLSAGWKTSLSGQRSWTMGSNGFVALDANYNLAYLTNLIVNRTLVTLNFKTANSGDYYYQGTGWLTSVQATAPNNANTTYSASFEGSGPLALIAAGSGGDSGGGITIIASNATISGASALYEAISATPITITLDHINNIVGKMPIVNQGSANVIISSADSLLIDGRSAIILTTGQSVTIYANNTKFDVVGTYSLP